MINNIRTSSKLFIDYSGYGLYSIYLIEIIPSNIIWSFTNCYDAFLCALSLIKYCNLEDTVIGISEICLFILESEIDNICESTS